MNENLWPYSTAAMRFCSQCDNMYYLRIGGEEQEESPEPEGGAAPGLVYYCRHCGHQDVEAASTASCVMETVIRSEKQQYTQAVNEYTRSDPTLPRTDAISCPSAECPSNGKDVKREVIYLRYDEASLKYLYVCAHCGMMWKTSTRS